MNSESIQKFDGSAQGVFKNLNLEEGKSLMQAIALNEEQYYNAPPR
jgi:hypothetical protein